MATLAAESGRPGVLARHWPEYAMEAALLGLFMISACGFTALLEHPGSPVHQAVPDPFLRRMLMGLAMGGTAVVLIYSPWGLQSGAHFNPATTLTFLRLGRIAPADAAGYVAAQFAGAVIGVSLAAIALGGLAAHEKVRYAATLPGPQGPAAAWLAELGITFILMTVILRVSNHPRFARLTGLCAGLLVATYITFEAPISGMSLNPARTFGSAAVAGDWTAMWVYFTAPPLGMLAAAEVYLRSRGAPFCAKLVHDGGRRCIHCESRRAADG
ncbi:MAG TPA: aquaporin [Gemmatimonadales bacterium]|nr:aquaporin [Gemmatimonadales bacterium]